jgi:hypothetical protein
MKASNTNSTFTLAALIITLVTFLGCTKEGIDDLKEPEFPVIAAVFLDDFSGDLEYAAFGGSDVRAFDIERQETYKGSSAGMRFAIPDANSPAGSYAGGVFFSRSGRNLSSFNALTFYIKASQAATVGVVGLGNDLGESKYQVNLSNLLVNSNWKKVIIPIPDPSKLTAERGLFYLAAGPENSRGYTLYIDEVKFENLTTLGTGNAQIFNGEDRVLSSAENGETINIDGISYTANMPTGVNETFGMAPGYLDFVSSASSVATVSTSGIISVLSGGTTVITATIGKKDAVGSMNLTSIGASIAPATAAPLPTQEASNVISMYSNQYTNVPIGTWNTGWQYSTAATTFIKVDNDDVIRYRNLNFVGIEFTNPTINASAMQFLHMDIWTPDATALPNNFKVKLVDFGANNVFGGGDDKEGEVTITAPTLVTNNWVSLDMPLSSFSGLTTRANLAQMILSGTIPNIFIDNVYYYKTPSNVTTAAPTPTINAANVLSVFSDAYTNIPGTDFFPNWGQTTTVTQTPIQGNNTLLYSNFNYQGTQFATGQNVSSYGFLHLDYFSSNASSLNVYLISAGPVEKGVALPVPTSGWNSIDIPLSSFSPVNLTNVIQMKFDGGSGSDIYLDNIFFWKIPPSPGVGAPVPNYAASGVTSIFSDSYTNVPGSDLNPNWGQSTVVTQIPISGNNSLLYTGLNYQGLQFGSAQNVSNKNFLHLDYYSSNSTSLEVYLISPGPVETPVKLTVPTGNGWSSADIPLSSFSPVDLTNVIQLKFVGNGNIYLDNILFRQ